MTKTLDYEMNPIGAMKLICAIVEQAVTDYKQLVKRGRIVSGKTYTPAQGKRVLNDYKYDFEAQQLVSFFKKGGALDQWLALGHIPINPDRIRDKLSRL